MTKEQYIEQQALIELSKREFFYFCHAMAPDFYLENRQFLVDICNQLQVFVDSDDEVLVLNMGPRHGKSRTAQLFVPWLMGKNNSIKVMTGSYNELLSTMFSRNVRDMIMEEKADENRIVYKDIFPNTSIKKGDGAMKLWSLDAGYNNYLATSPGGTATGFGANIIIIDDLIKNAYEASNSTILDGHWEWFSNTMLSRLEANGKLIIIMTRWSNKDLAGRVLEWCKNENKKYKHINLKTYLGDGKMLCEDVLSYKDYLGKISAMSEEIVEANYQQHPIDVKGRLYNNLKTYTELPTDINNLRIQSYTDTADTGQDYLCNIIYAVYQGYVYILDIIYTQAPMEITEPEVANAFIKHSVVQADIESNNGGRGFGRNVESITKSLGNYSIKFHLFHQSKNKIARILSQATNVMNLVHFPSNWDSLWPEFYRDITEYQRSGKNAHDDGPDCLTGVVEYKEKRGAKYEFV